jgi:Iap family predicted aminopeptidase
MTQSISNLITQEILKFGEKACEKFSGITVKELVSIWCEQQQICDLEPSDKEALIEQILTKLEKGTLIESISNLISQEIRKFAEKMCEKFSGITVNELLSIWCEQQQRSEKVLTKNQSMSAHVYKRSESEYAM